MSVLAKIKLPIEQELKDFEPYFKQSLQSDVPLLGTIIAPNVCVSIRKVAWRDQ